MPYKKQKAISSNKKHNKYGLMTDLGLSAHYDSSSQTAPHINDIARQAMLKMLTKTSSSRRCVIVHPPECNCISAGELLHFGGTTNRRRLRNER